MKIIETKNRKNKTFTSTELLQQSISAILPTLYLISFLKTPLKDTILKSENERIKLTE